MPSDIFSVMKRKLLLFLLVFIAIPFVGISSPNIKHNFIEGPYQCNVLKEKKSFKKRFRDIKTSGRFLLFEIEFVNKDIIAHLVDYSCFCVTDNNGNEYDVHPYATMVKQTELEDINLLKDVDVYGFSNQTIKSNFGTRGWLIFEVPAIGEYKIKFRGYLK